jgi:hypothetical protein
MPGTGGQIRKEVPVHGLRPNDKVWTPPHVIFLDSESSWVTEGSDELHSLRLWVGCRVDRRNLRKTQEAERWGAGETRADLAEWITAVTKGRGATWLYAHNLNFDMAVTALPIALRREGWTIGDFSLTGRAPWMRLSRGNRVLTMVDSYSWLPTALESLATLYGDRKVELPGNTDSLDDWHRRCAKDVQLLKRSVLDLMDWWDTNQLGRWTITGAGCGWNAMRHHWSPQRHVIDVTPELVAQDRAAVRGGRKDAQVVLRDGGGPWAELDLVGAYPTVARELPLPIKRAWQFDSLPLDSRWLRSNRYGVIAEVVINTDRARYPVRCGGVGWYPVGRFRTTLAGPELLAAVEAGHVETIGAGQSHRLGHALTPWATWVLDPSRQGAQEVPPVAGVATKAWGRSVIGRFASRSHDAVALEGVASEGWSIQEGWNRAAGAKMHMIEMGGQAWMVTDNYDSENCYPAVLAWVESEVRVRLGRVLDRLGASWWTCDTDGLIVDLDTTALLVAGGAIPRGGRGYSTMDVAAALCDDLAPLVAPLVLRPKRIIESLRVLGPQHMTTDGERHMSGVPRAAVETAPDAFTVRDWPKLKWQVRNSVPGLYRRPERKVRFRRPTVHRWVTEGGDALPVEMTISAAGENVLLPWADTRWAKEGHRLAAVQYERLARLSS